MGFALHSSFGCMSFCFVFSPRNKDETASDGQQPLSGLTEHRERKGRTKDRTLAKSCTGRGCYISGKYNYAALVTFELHGDKLTCKRRQEYAIGVTVYL